MKRVRIIDNCFIPGEAEGEMKPVFTGSVMDLDDNVAGQIVAAGRAVYDKKADPVDTTPKAPSRRGPAETKAEG